MVANQYRVMKPGLFLRKLLAATAAQVALFCGAFALDARGATNQVALIQTLGADFSPAVYLAADPLVSFQWVWFDGSTDTNWPVATTTFGSPAARWQTLEVSPGGVITGINLGFDGSDGGWTDKFEARPNQQVGAVTFPNGPLINLQLWASSYSPITNTLDFSGFINLQDIECFHCSNLEHVVVSGLPSLRRLCFEDCLLRELDVSNNPNLEDVRAALNAFNSVKIGGGTGPKIWHWCMRDNPQITEHFQDIMTNFFSLQELWIWSANQSGALTFVSTNLTDVEVHHNAYTYADFSGQTNLAICQINDNQLTNLLLTGCSSLQILEAQNNRLTTAALDQILATLDNPAGAIQSINLANNLEFPSSEVYAHYTNLNQRSVYVNLDFPDSNPKKVAVKVQSSPAGRSLTVDGQTFSGARTFLWTPGTSHSISTVPTQNDSTGRHYDWLGWSDGGGISHLVAPKTATTYTAQFSNPFTALAGSYNGLFFESNSVHHATSGGVGLFLTDRGSFSGSLWLAGKRYPLSGQFDLNGSASDVISANGDSVTVSLELDMTPGVGLILGTVGDGVWSAPLEAVQAGFSSKLNPATNFSGSYTLILPRADAASGLPQGYGFGTIKLDRNGKVSLSGMLGDATPFTLFVPISAQGEWPFYLSLYGGKGSLLGWMSFSNTFTDDLHGDLSWIRPAMAVPKFYPGGFTNTDQIVTGSRYVAPVGPNRVLNLTNGAAEFTGGNLSASFTNSVTLGANNKVINNGANKLTFSISLPNGGFNGLATPPGGSKSVPFRGVLFQKQNAAFGIFSGTNETGAVRLRSNE